MSEAFQFVFITLVIVFCVLGALVATGWFGYTLVLGVLAIHHEHGVWGFIPSGILCFGAFARCLQTARQ